MLVSRRLLGAIVARAALLGALQPVGGFIVPLAGGRAGGAALARTAQRRGRAAAASCAAHSATRVAECVCRPPTEPARYLLVPSFLRSNKLTNLSLM